MKTNKLAAPFILLKNRIPNWVIYFISIPITIFLSFLVIEYVSGIEVHGAAYYIQQFDLRNLLLSSITIGILWSILFILCHRVWLANLLCGCICSGIAIANHYVILFHGMPLSFLVLRNFTTAMNVIRNYELTLDGHVIRVLFLTACLIIFSLLTKWFTKPVKASRLTILVRDGILILLCIAGFYTCYLGENPVKPRKTIGWIWTEPYARYGYAACTVETLFQSISVVNEPDGYTQSALDNISISHRQKEESQTPDIILILNESFYDLKQATDFETDVPYMKNISSMENLLKGYAVVPGAGGGTNSAEYELLTSNSLQLMPGVTPFNTINLNGANSITHHLNSLGYYSLGSHSEPAVNYSRISGYRDLQFQEIHFEEDFEDVAYFHDRMFETDESLYRNLIRWYEAAPSEAPRFMYLLTIQNHGGYEMNAVEHDTIHILNDWGSNTEIANEFLSALSLSDQSFKTLTDYFSTVARPVIICMVGDHAPNFVKSIISNQYSGAEADLRHRSVPLLIWANFELENIELGTMSMNYVVPTLLDIANVQLTPYYSYMLQLKQQIPILTSYGNYYDTDRNLYSYDSDEGAPYEQMVNNYFYLEYENLQSNRKQELFEPYQ